MQCLRCKTENEDAAKFCASCGTPLYKASAPVVCQVCAHANAPGANFCVACGSHLRHRFVPPSAVPPVTPPSAAGRGEEARMASDAAAARPRPEPSERFPEAAIPPSPIPGSAADRPAAPPNGRPVAGAAAPRQESFESAAIPPPRISSFELKAGLAVLILFLGGGVFWWSSQNDSRLAELALTAATPASSAIRAVANTALEHTAPPELAQGSPSDARYTASADIPAPNTAAPAPPAAPTNTPAVDTPAKTKAAKHKNVKRHRGEAERPIAVPEPVPEPEIVAQSTPPEKRKPNVRELVASCRRMSLFEGERCLWRICDGKWGKDGCPSYN